MHDHVPVPGPLVGGYCAEGIVSGQEQAGSPVKPKCVLRSRELHQAEGRSRLSPRVRSLLRDAAEGA